MSKYDSNLLLSENESQTKILKRIKSGSRVLEFGSAHGIMSKYLKEDLLCKLYAVELDSGAALDSGKYCDRILVDNIENYTWKEEFKELKFDYIIFADVLEHLYDPWKVLREVRPFLSEGGRVLISLPNIAHNAVIMNLIDDDFSYRPLGILDNTHIRFFTKSTIDNMVDVCGYETVNIDAIFLDPQFTEFSKHYSDYNRGLVNQLNKRSHGHVYQYIYEVKVLDEQNNASMLQQTLVQPLSIELYFDTGSGYNGAQCIKSFTAGKGEIDLSHVDNLLGLRFDPDHVSGILRKYKFIIRDEQDNLYDCSIDSFYNRNYDISNQHIFLNSDPQIFLNIPSVKIKSLIYEIDYQPIYLSIEDINELSLLDKVLSLLDKVKDELELTKSELSMIHNSISWRITKPLRKVIKFLKNNRRF